jgi:oligopeptidase B
MPSLIRPLWAGLAALAVAACAHTPTPNESSTMNSSPNTPVTATIAPTLEFPRAARIPYQVESPHGARVDEYYWLRDDERKNPQMLDYLNAENAYTDAQLAPIAPLKQKLYDEFIARIKQDDATVPYRERGYWYYTRYETGKEYPIHARRAGSMEAPEQVLLNVNEMAEGKDFFQVDEYEVSPDGQMLVWAEDDVGRRQYVLRFKDLKTGAVLPERIENAEANMVWAADNRTILYVEKDPQTLLGYKVRKHVLGTDSKNDPLVWEQTDESFYTGVGKTKDDRYLVIGTQSTVSSEYWYADAADPKLEFKLFLARERDHEYQVEHFDGRWIVRSNWQAKNFRIVEVARGSEAQRDTWRDLVPHDPQGFVHGFDVFRRFMAVELRSGGLRRILIRPWKAPPVNAARGLRETFITADEPTYTMALGTNEEIDTDTVRYIYTSLATPVTTYDLNAVTGERTLMKREPVLGDFDPANYVSEYVWATARDGAKVPVSIVYRKGTPRDGTAPMLQYGYGSYGLSMDPTFSISLLSLLDRGFVYAIAHIRGGQEMGRAWYEDGRLLKKMNTFADFIDVTRFLVAQQYADPRRVFAFGGSAGGLLMGAVANLAPQHYRGIVSIVPFVDVVTTMLDETIPLTTNEFDEWGNPKQKPFYDYMLSYSPYDNLERQDYPAMYMQTGLWDSQVQYWESAKYVAKLRTLKTDANLLVLRTEMEAGHGGKSGRFRRLQEVAEQYAFVVSQAGLTN